MKEAIIQPDLSVKLIESPIPTSSAGQIIIKVVVAAANPIDWKGVLPEEQIRLHGKLEAAEFLNSGKDVAGYVHAVGSGVEQFKPGDRVAATNHGSGYAEYSVSPVHTAYRIPDGTSFEDAASLGLPYITAALGLFNSLRLPSPWAPATTKTPLVIYGASSAVGLYAVKLARLANIHPIIAIAGQGGKIVAPFLDPGRGDALIDYRQEHVALIAEVKSKAGDVENALDAISTLQTVELMGEIVNPKTGTVAIVLKQDDPPNVPAGVSMPLVFAPALWEPIANDVGDEHATGSDYAGLKAFAVVYYHYLTYALGKGLLESHPAEVVPGGLGGLPTGLKNLRDGVKSGVKFLFRVEETKGL
ncbi:groes-like alcohol dehydrogenase [Aulographum hederae CBS 113979]|uniref:Groes-like alcohol dehydrogenase n=1 Tax=Aulographum hederae CBS 113979 TaxID=1176131 RepID=A0A6G1HAT9_9PEZI|nr:groes-like alcohol dehydrogenase [Aulographum hederae CBS 113979]